MHINAELVKREYIEDINLCIRLLETLKNDYITPGTSSAINSDKVKRIRLTIHDILKRY